VSQAGDAACLDTGQRDDEREPCGVPAAASLPRMGPSQFGFIHQTLASVQGWMADLTTRHDLTPDKVLGGVHGLRDVAGDRLDHVAAFLDITTNDYEHTGIPSVARSLIERVATEI
jgi:hypothetical protein